MKRLVWIGLLLLIVASGMGQRHVVEFGGRVAGAAWLTDGPLSARPGVQVGVDGRYRYLRRVDRSFWIGPELGLSLGYTAAAWQLPDYHESYRNYDYYSEPMDYAITASSYREHQRHLQLEIPLLLAVRTDFGLRMALGVKGMMTASRQRELDIRDPYVRTFYPDFEVMVYDEMITGRVGREAHHRGAGTVPVFSAMVTAELGYEWNLPYRRGAIGVSVYADYGLWSSYRGVPQAQRLIDISPIVDRDYPVPTVRTHYLSDTYVSQMNYLSVGLRLFYAIPYDQPGCWPCMLLRR